MQRQSTQPAPIAKRSSSGVTRTRPSPSTASSVSPKKKAGSRSIKRTDDETCDEDELSDEENKDKLEEKREKNRVKQRNLRCKSNSKPVVTSAHVTQYGVQITSTSSNPSTRGCGQRLPM